MFWDILDLELKSNVEDNFIFNLRVELKNIDPDDTLSGYPNQDNMAVLFPTQEMVTPKINN